MEKINKNMKKIIRMATIMFIAILILIIVVLLILKYQVEGEKNMPFELSKIMVISTAEGINKEENTTTWNLNIVQNNDIYIEISKNKNYKETEIIDKITLDNFKVIKAPEIGDITIYRPTSEENKTYDNIEENIIKDKLEYVGSTETNIRNLELANQGGMILLRYSLNNVSEYYSEEDTEIKHDGTLLAKTNISIEQIQCEVEFDLTIQLKSGISYKGTINLKLPSGNIVEQGISNIEIENFDDVVFKRL